MQRATIAGISAAVLSAVLLTGCADSYECTSTQPVYFNTEDGLYHYENVGGPVAPAEDVKHSCADDPDGTDAAPAEVDVDGHKIRKSKQAAPRPAAPKTRK